MRSLALAGLLAFPLVPLVAPSILDEPPFCLIVYDEDVETFYPYDCAGECATPDECEIRATLSIGGHKIY